MGDGDEEVDRGFDGEACVEGPLDTSTRASERETDALLMSYAQLLAEQGGEGRRRTYSEMVDIRV